MNKTFWNWDRLQTIDRRIIYAVLLVFILIPLFLPGLQLPNYPAKQSVDFYDTVERVGAKDPASAHKIVIIDGQWSPSTRGENQWQAEAIVTHLMQKHLRFATIAFDTQNETVTRLQVVEPLAKEVRLRVRPRLRQLGLPALHGSLRADGERPGDRHSRARSRKTSTARPLKDIAR